MKFVFLKRKMLKRKEGFKQSAVPLPLLQKLRPLHRKPQRLLLELRPILPRQGHLL